MESCRATIAEVHACTAQALGVMAQAHRALHALL